MLRRPVFGLDSPLETLERFVPRIRRLSLHESVKPSAGQIVLSRERFPTHVLFSQKSIDIGDQIM